MVWRGLFASLALALVFAALPAFAVFGFNDRGGSEDLSDSEVTFVITETPGIPAEPEPMARDMMGSDDCPKDYEPVVEG